jgi:hypothetical protein
MVMHRLALIVLVLGLTFCTSPSPVSEAPFGEAVWGFVHASSSNGRLVVLHRFSGNERPSFGHHGEPMVPSEVTIYDLVADQQRTVAEFVGIDARRRWVLALDDGKLWLIDANTGTWEALEGVDMEDDNNRCLSPRQASFSDGGRRVAWIRADARALQVRDLVRGKSWSIPAEGRLWRAWPADEGRGGVLLEVAAGSTEWPIQRTSCACTWCTRFAMVYSTFGWSGPAYDIIEVANDGSRGDGELSERDYEWHGPTSSGCTLKASEDDGEALERGPWRWIC